MTGQTNANLQFHAGKKYPYINETNLIPNVPMEAGFEISAVIVGNENTEFNFILAIKFVQFTSLWLQPDFRRISESYIQHLFS
jgi:hypothetical protein